MMIEAAYLYYYGGGGAPALNYSQELLYAMFLNQPARPFVDTPPTYSVDSHTSVLYNGEGKIRSFSPQPRTVQGEDGNYYIAVATREDFNRDILVLKYNPTTNCFEQEFRIRHGLVHEDTHRTPHVAIDASGNIIIVYESLHVGETHGSSINVWKTTKPYDIHSLVQINVLPGRWSYPQVWVDGDDVFVSARGSTNTISFIRGQYWYFKSTDGGATFGSAIKLYQADSENQPAYIFMYPSRDGGITLILNERNNTTSNWSFISVLRGEFDSDTWADISGSFSKDVVGAGYITRTEATGIQTIASATNDNDVNVDGAVVKSDGSIGMLVSMWTQTGNTFAGNPEGELDELRYYYYDEGWQYNNVEIPEGIVIYRSAQRNSQLAKDDNFADVVFIDRNNNNDVYRFRSGDKFATQTDTLIRDGDVTFRVGPPDYDIIIIIQGDGDPFELTDEGPEDFANLLILQQ